MNRECEIRLRSDATGPVQQGRRSKTKGGGCSKLRSMGVDIVDIEWLNEEGLL